MTTTPAIPSARANACRTRFGFARPFASLPISMKEKIVFDHITGLAVWRTDGDGHEPPPYWRDEGGDIHNL